MDNYQDVVQQMEAFGVEFTSRCLPLQVPTLKRRTFGKKGKWWYWLQEFRPRAGGCYIVGKFGSYRTGEAQRVEIDWKPLSDAERERFRAERQAAAARAVAAKQRAAEVAAVTASEVWRQARPQGESPYLQRKGVVGESCRYLHAPLALQRTDPTKRPIGLPAGTLVLPLIRYDYPRSHALRGLQLIKPDGFKIYTEDVAKAGCALRLGVLQGPLGLVCEGYATGLSLRMATGGRFAVFVAWDAYNLTLVVPMLRALYPRVFWLVCADDDWQTADHDGPNPGRRKAMGVAKTVQGCDVVWPVFAAATRELKDTDFNDLHARQGLAAVERQLATVVDGMQRRYGFV